MTKTERRVRRRFEEIRRAFACRGRAAAGMLATANGLRAELINKKRELLSV